MLDNWCIESGAWDGVHLSNTCDLIQNKNYKAVLIEADVKRHRNFCKNFHPRMYLKYIGF